MSCGLACRSIEYPDMGNNLMRKRIIIFLQQYPQISETYIKNEIDALWDEYDIEILSMGYGNFPYRTRKPHINVNNSNLKNVIPYLQDFNASVIHTHYLHHAKSAAQFSEVLKIPYTVRTHSFDVLGKEDEYLRPLSVHVNSDNCLGVLAFPGTCDILLRAGVKGDKLHSCFPVVNYRRFHDEGPNGGAIMNVGAALPKKEMESFLALSKLRPERVFNLYALGYDVRELAQMNNAIGARVNFVRPIDPEDMPPEYKKHEWLVYTASRELATVGWPMAIAEAQASGVGVLMANIRPDLKEYVGDAGYLFNSIEEAADIIRNPFPDDLRQRGFSLAKRSDVQTHISQLTDLWPD